MQYNVQKLDHANVFLLEGKLFNEQQTVDIRQRIQDELAAGQKNFIFDLKGMEFVNSACLNFLIAARNKIVLGGGIIILCNVSDQLKKLLAVTKLESLFQITGRTADALEMLGRKS